ncbi:MAG: PKD domain-containing protein, partial [Pseudomonadota bacterium]
TMEALRVSGSNGTDSLFFDPGDFAQNVLDDRVNGRIGIDLPGFGIADQDQFELISTSAPPQIDLISADPVIDEGQGFAFDVEVRVDLAGLDGQVVSFDLDGDGLFDDAVAPATEVRTNVFAATLDLSSWQDLNAVGIVDDGEYVIGVRAENANGVAFRDFTLTVADAPPQVFATIPGTVDAGQPLQIRFDPFDFGDDPVVDWTIDWGDGTVETLGAGAREASHVYAQPGARTVRIDLNNEDGQAAATGAVTVGAPADALRFAADATIGEGEGAAFDIDILDGLALDLADVRLTILPTDIPGATPLVGALGQTVFTAAELRAAGIADEGSAVVQASATFAGGPTVTATGSLTVENRRPEVVDLAVAPAPEGAQTRLTGTLADPGLGDALRLRVDWGDGVQELLNAAPDGTFDVGHVYQDDGAFSIAVTPVDDADAEGAAASATAVIANAAPTLLLTPVAPSAVEGSAFALDLSATDVPQDTVVSWSVDWGDGSPLETVLGAAPRASHVYAQDGVYQISVAATDEDGSFGPATANAVIVNAAPDAPTGALAVATEGGETVLLGRVTDPGALDVLSVEVDWGDGSPAQTVATEADGSFRATHVYADEGDFSVRVTGLDDAAPAPAAGPALLLQASVANVAPVFDPSPVVDPAEADPDLATTLETFILQVPDLERPGQVRLAGAFTDPGLADAHVATVTWGDGATETLTLTGDPARAFDVTHDYAGEGLFVFDVTVRIDDGDGGVAEATRSITLDTRVPTTVRMPAAPVTLSEGQGASVVAQIDTGLAGLAGPVTADIFDEDGAQVAQGLAVALSGAAPSLVATLDFADWTALTEAGVTQEGRYRVVFNVDAGAEGVLRGAASLRVLNVAPDRPVLSLDPTAIDEGGVTTLSGTIADPGALGGLDVVIDWGDGSAPERVAAAGADAAGAAFAASHVYAQDGDYTIAVTAEDGDGEDVDVDGLAGPDIDDDGPAGVSAAAVTTVSVANVAPQLTGAPVASGAVEGSAGRLQGALSDVGLADALFVRVDWGDGTVETLAAAADGGFDLSHVYVQDSAGQPGGSYAVTVAPLDDAGAEGAAQTVALVVENARARVADADVTEAVEGALSTVSGTLSDLGAADALTLRIDWGDGTEQTVDIAGDRSFSADHAYAQDGVYRITLTPVDEVEDGRAAALDATVLNAAPQASALVVAPAQAGQPATLAGALADAGLADALGLRVDWGDGTVE